MNLASRLCGTWQNYLQFELQQDYMRSLSDFLEQEKRTGAVVFPPSELIFNALNTTSFESVKVVVLGQDPYHGAGLAHGLSFSVLPGVKAPPSLSNIFKELNEDLNLVIPDHGCLQAWAEQGVLLLNDTLTVREGEAGSHQGQGWERFTDQVVQLLNDEKQGVVFLLWGSHAQKKGRIIDCDKHCVLTAVHPSPLSAYRGFFGCGHFSAANEYLIKKGADPINWSLPSIQKDLF